VGVLDRLAGRPDDTSHAEALARAEHGVAVYWRPGCPFCARLRLALRRCPDQVAWVDIWQDDEGRAFVASVNGGDETVPTVVVDGVAHTNPRPAFVVEAARRSR
jgi:glutaredoxin